MEYNFLKDLKTKTISFDDNYFYEKKISDLKHKPFENFVNKDFVSFEEFKNFFTFSGDLYLKGLLSFIRRIILPFPEEDFINIKDHNNKFLKSYLITQSEYGTYNAPEEYLIQKQAILQEYILENHFEEFKIIEQDILNELTSLYESRRPFKIEKLRKLYDFIFNNNFINFLNELEGNVNTDIYTLLVNSNLDEGLKNIFNELKIILTSSLIFLRHTKEKYLNINFDENRSNYTNNDLLVNLQEYMDKIRMEIDIKNPKKLLKHTFSDLNFNSLLFFELIQKIADHADMGTCSNCGHLFTKSNQQKRWKNIYCSKECRDIHKNYISNKNKKERLEKDPEYRKKNNEYQAKKAKEYRRKKVKD